MSAPGTPGKVVTCRHNIEHVGCPSCQRWRQLRDREVAEQQQARFDASNAVMRAYLQRRYPVAVS